MKIILLQDDRKLGKKDSVIEVKDGYGTFLINSKKAIQATKTALTKLGYQKESDRLLDSQMKTAAEYMKKSLESQFFPINISYNKQNQMLNGSITKDMVIKSIKQFYPDIDLSFDFVEFPKTRLAQHYKAKLKLYKNIVANIEFGVDFNGQA